MYSSFRSSRQNQPINSIQIPIFRIANDPRARIEGFSMHNSDPAVFTIAPIAMHLDCSLSVQSYEPSISSTEQATLKDCSISGNSIS